MKSGNKQKVESLRFLKAAVGNREIELRPKEISDEETVKVIKKVIKQLNDSIDQYKKAGRKDLVSKEEVQLQFLKEYLPEQMGEKELEDVISKVIAQLGASSPKDMGKVMKEVLSQVQGNADGKLVSQLVKKKLG